MDLNEWLQVDPTSPSGLSWKRQKGRAQAGSPAGTQKEKGYWYVRFEGQCHAVHRLILLLSGIEPNNGKTFVDHINRDPSDNRLENLRWVTQEANQRNQGKRTNLSPYKHTYPAPSGRWIFRCNQNALGLCFSLTANSPAEAFYLGLARRLELSWI
jgi:hypothetical protein